MIFFIINFRGSHWYQNEFSLWNKTIQAEKYPQPKTYLPRTHNPLQLV